MAPLINAQLENALQQRTLGNTRDALLPKLLSGEVPVKEAEVESTISEDGAKILKSRFRWQFN